MTQSSYRQSSRTSCSPSSMPTLPATSALNPSPGLAQYKPRNTRVGSLELLIPQDRDGGTELLSISAKALVLSLMTIYLQGVSTRNLRDVSETLCPASFSKSLVS